MKLNILFAAQPSRWLEYREPLTTAFDKAGISANLGTDIKPQDVDYIVLAPNGPISDFSAFLRLKAVLGLWAGVEGIVRNVSLKVPLTRMVDSGLAEGMTEWVTGHVLRYHLDLDRHITSQNGVWDPVIPPLARHRGVGILGLGELGQSCAKALTQLNFKVSGWSRSPKNISGIRCLSGPDGLSELLKTSDIIVLLLPLTEATENIIDEASLSLLPKGAMILNPGRGALIDDGALLAALGTGQVGHATLDVFRTEPLPKDDPYWSHPNVTVTPHIASETRADTSSQVIAENIRRFEAGEPMKFIVDRKAGY
ncbi:MAG: 2-hydroxyacid dehydrogenase [Paracoccaceae bacterium]